jgi:hypothetical protein
LKAKYVFPNLGIEGSHIINLYPLDSEPFYSATILPLVTVIFAPFIVLENLNYSDYCKVDAITVGSI